MKQKKKMSLAMQIFIALILPIVVGLLMQSHAEFAESYIKPFGTIFLNLVKFIVVPIVLFSIMCGIISMQDIKKVGAIGLKTVVSVSYTHLNPGAEEFGMYFQQYLQTGRANAIVNKWANEIFGDIDFNISSDTLQAMAKELAEGYTAYAKRCV